MTEPITAENLLLNPPANPDPRCPEDCEACDNLPYGQSVRKEQWDAMATAIKASGIFSRIMTEQAKTPPEDYDLRDMALAAQVYGSAFASVVGMLLKEAPELAHKAVLIHQDMYSNGDVWHTEELYAEIEAANAVKAAEAAK